MKYFSKETRQKMSEAAKKRCTPEWRKAKSEAYSTKLPTDKVRMLYESGKTQMEIAEHFGTTQKVVWRFMWHNGIKARTAQKRNQFAENNDSWRGDEAGYQALHARLYRTKGQPNRCEWCGECSPNKTYDWANLSGNYADIDDYVRLCRSCHWKLDKKHKNFKGGGGAK